MGVEIVGHFQGDGGALACQCLDEVDGHLAIESIDPEGAAPVPFSLNVSVSGRINLVFRIQRVWRTDRREQRSFRIAICVPVEDVDSRGAGAMVAAGDRFGAQVVLLILLFRAYEGIG